VGVTPTVEIPTAIDTVTDALTPSLPAVTATPIALETAAHHNDTQHWRPAHDTAVLSAIVCTADRAPLSTVRCRSTSSRQADRRPSTAVGDPRIDGSPQRVIDRRSPLARLGCSAWWPTSSDPLVSALDAGRNATATAASNAALRQPRCPADQRRSTPLSSVPTTTVRTAPATTTTALRTAQRRPPSLPLSAPPPTTYAI